MPNDEAELWGKWLTDRMAEAGIDAAELVARGQGRFGKTAASRWLNGDSRPDAETALLVAEILGVPESEALGASGYLKVAGAMSRLAAAEGEEAFVANDPAREIIGFEHLPDELKATLVDVYREHAEAARKQAQAMADEMLKRRDDPAD